MMSRSLALHPGGGGRPSGGGVEGKRGVERKRGEEKGEERWGKRVERVWGIFETEKTRTHIETHCCDPTYMCVLQMTYTLNLLPLQSNVETQQSTHSSPISREPPHPSSTVGMCTSRPLTVNTRRVGQVCSGQRACSYQILLWKKFALSRRVSIIRYLYVPHLPPVNVCGRGCEVLLPDFLRMECKATSTLHWERCPPRFILETSGERV